MTESYARQRARRAVRDSPGKRLTPHQLVVLKLLSFGWSYVEVAAWLDIRVDTVKSHVRSLYRRLGVNNAPHAVRVGMERGLLRTYEAVPLPDEVPLRRGAYNHAAYRVLLDEDDDEGT